MLPGNTHAIQCTGCKVLDKDVAFLDERVQNLFAFWVLGVQRNRSLVVVEHGEVQTVHAGDVAQLAASGVTLTGTLHLDDVGTEPGQQLGTSRPRLNVGKVQNADSV